MAYSNIEILIDTLATGSEDSTKDDTISSNQIYIDSGKSNEARELSRSVTEINGISLFTQEYREDMSIIVDVEKTSENDFQHHIFNDLQLENEAYSEVKASLFTQENRSMRYSNNDSNDSYLIKMFMSIFIIVVVVGCLFTIYVLRIAKNKRREEIDDSVEG